MLRWERKEEKNIHKLFASLRAARHALRGGEAAVLACRGVCAGLWGCGSAAARERERERLAEHGFEFEGCQSRLPASRRPTGACCRLVERLFTEPSLWI